MNDLDRLFRGLGVRVVARGGRVHHMLADMILDHFGDEAVERAAAPRRRGPAALPLAAHARLSRRPSDDWT
jgi:hypothetical protein